MIRKRSIKATAHCWRKMVEACFERDGQRCQVCRFWFPKENLHPHHIIPRGRIRIDHPDNLLTVCSECHRGIHDHLPGWPSVDDLIEKYRPRIEKFLKGETS
jgi:5-methylcytosine-specific restriction endonuclease McrA